MEVKRLEGYSVCLDWEIFLHESCGLFRKMQLGLNFLSVDSLWYSYTYNDDNQMPLRRRNRDPFFFFFFCKHT